MTSISSHCRLTSTRCFANGEELAINRASDSFLNDVYRTLNVGYPKFFKMDNLCKAGFLAAELVLKGSSIDRVTPRNDVSIICINRSSSLDDDIAYQKTIECADSYFPSPSVFVYTLANIVTGEIAIRNKIQGESSFYIFEKFSALRMSSLIDMAFSDTEINHLICGWVEVLDKSVDVLMLLVDRNTSHGLEITDKTINNLYYN